MEGTQRVREAGVEANSLAGDTDRTKVTFTETGKTAVWEGGNKSSVWDILSLPSCKPVWHGRQIMRKSLHNVDSAAVVLSAKSRMGKVTQEGVFREGCLEEAHRSGGQKAEEPEKSKGVVEAAASECSPPSSPLHLQLHTQRDGVPQ